MLGQPARRNLSRSLREVTIDYVLYGSVQTEPIRLDSSHLIAVRVPARHSSWATHLHRNSENAPITRCRQAAGTEQDSGLYRLSDPLF
jgi:hypothetical protein